MFKNYFKSVSLVFSFILFSFGCAGGETNPSDGTLDREQLDWIDIQQEEIFADVPQDSECPEGETLCAGVCVNLQSDVNNCGRCGNACGSGQVCSNGNCSDECESPLVNCSGSCVDLMKDKDNCGQCGNKCNSAQHAIPVCNAGDCGIECEPGWSDIDKNIENGCEAQCTPTSSNEICNGIDDNCNGRVDEGFDCSLGMATSCTTRCGSTGTGICGADCSIPSPDNCNPPPELCNGVDDDCNGEVDNGFMCARGSVVDCRTDCGTPGTGICTSTCEIPTGSACAGGAEICNGIDDNCNGSIDETFQCARGSTVNCTTTCGTQGTGRCTDNCTLPSPAECTPPSESCNGMDDDCDRVCDNGFICCVGATDSQSCGNCGTQTRTCTSSCSWGSWGACTGEGVCSPGATESQSCGNCGTMTRTCSSSCQWGSWGTCTGEGVCTPGTTQTQSCGNCGTQTRTCTSSCQWGSWGACTGEGVCSPGSIDTQSCGNCGTMTRTCTSSCQWGSWGACTGEGVCTPGTTQTQSCGNCGTQTRTCTSSCQWGSWGTCTGEGVCSPGSIDTQSCGNCGTQTRSCNASCQWDPWGTCLNQGVCTPGATQSCSFGSCSGTQTCNSSCQWGSCNFGATPSNDTCAGAINVGGGGTFTGTTCGANNDYAGSCGSSTSPEVVYVLNLSVRSNVDINTCSGTSWDTVLYLRSGSCTGTEIGCSDDACGVQSRITATLDPGTYYIFVDGFGSGNAGAFTLSVSAVPVNDACTNAIDISAGGTFNGNTTGATDDSGACAGSGIKGVWYRFTLSQQEVVYLDTQDGNLWDSVITVKSGSCTGSNVLCGDDSCSNGRSQIAGVLSAGTYYVLVSGYFSSAYGPFTLRYQHSPCPGAVALSTSQTGNTSGWGNHTTASCGSGAGSEDRPYYLTKCPGSSSISANTCTGTSYDSVLYIRSGSGGTCGSTEVACNDDSCGLQSSVSATVTGPGLFFVIVDGYSSGNVGAYTLTASF